MSEFPVLSFVGLNTFKMWEGSSHSLLDFEGFVLGKIDTAAPEWTKKKDKGMVKIELTALDDDVQGRKLTDRVIYSGVDAKGNNLARQFCQLLCATGTPEATIQAYGSAGATMPIEDAIGQLAGREVCFEVRHGVNAENGQRTTEITNFVTREVYEKSKTNGTYRRNLVPAGSTAPVGGAPRAPGAPAPTGFAPAGGGAPMPNFGGPAAPTGAPIGNGVVAPSQPLSGGPLPRL